MAPAGSTTTPSRPLQVLLVTAPSDAAAGATSRLLAGSARLAVDVLALPDGSAPAGVAAVVRRLAERPADVVLATGDASRAAAVGACLLRGGRVVTVDDGVPSAGRRARLLAALSDGRVRLSTPDALAAELAAAAQRPGAGLVATAPVSVVVPVFDEGPAVEPMLRRLLALLEPDDEVVVVDDGSRDDTAERVERLAAAAGGQVRLVRQPANAGAGAARNAGVAVARHDLLAFTDAGCVPAGGWLEAVRRAFAEAPRPDLVAGVYEVSTDGAFQRAVAAACYPVIAETQAPDLLSRLYTRVLGLAFEPTRPAGRSLAVRRGAFDAVGGFPSGKAAAEDIVFARAVARAGLRCVLAPGASVTWEQRPGLRKTARMYARYGWGDAGSGDRQAVVRDLVRAAAYPVAVTVLRRGPAAAQAAVVLGGAAYLSLPVRRVVRAGASADVLAAVPVALAVKDGAKAAGCLAGLAARRLGAAPSLRR